LQEAEAENQQACPWKINKPVGRVWFEIIIAALVHGHKLSTNWFSNTSGQSNIGIRAAWSPRLDQEKMNGRLKPQGQWFDTGGFQTKLAGRKLSFSAAMNRVEPSLQNANDFHAATAKRE